MSGSALGCRFQLPAVSDFFRRTILFNDHPSPRYGALLLHGFTGNPNTMRPFKAPLEALGVQVALSLLRGHGGIFAASVDRRHLS